MVSIVVPYYNRPEKLDRTLKSIYNQTYTDYEVILIDDCSIQIPDIEKYNLNYVRNIVNLGPGISRNIGKSKAKGDYLVFLDSDDYLHKDFLKKTVTAITTNSRAIMAYSNGFYVDVNGVILEEMRKDALKPEIILPNLLLFGRPWGTGACLWRSKHIESLNWINSRCWEDYVFDTSAALVCNEIVYVNEHLIFYDQTDSEEKLSNQYSITTVKDKNISLYKIAELIESSPFFSQVILRNKIFHLAINDIIALLKYDVLEKKYYNNNIKIIRIYRGLFMSLIVNFIINFNKKTGLRLLRRLRNIL